MSEGVREYYAELLRTMRQKFDDLAKEIVVLERVLRPDLYEAELWPVFNDEYGGIMCGQDDCRCDGEGSVILVPFKDLTYPPFPPYTARQLLDAIEQHIVNMKEEED